MEKYSRLLLIIFFTIFNNCYGMKKEADFIERPNEMTLEKIEKLGIIVKGYRTNSANKILELDLSDNDIKDLNALVALLEDLSILYFLNLEHCSLKDITPLKRLKKLKKLYLDNNNIKEITGLEKLTDLSLKNNSVEIDFKGNRELYSKIDNFAYSVKQEIVRPEKKQKPETKIQPKKIETTNLPFTLKVSPPKKNPINSQKKLPTGSQTIEPAKQIGQKIRGDKRKNEGLEDTQSNKRVTLNPSNRFVTTEKKDLPKREMSAATDKATQKTKNNNSLTVEQKTLPATTSSYTTLTNWIIGGLTLAAVGASAYLFNRINKQKKVN